MVDYYCMLEVAQSATQNEIERSYNRLCAKWDPKMPENAKVIHEATLKTEEIREAYEVLSNSDRRKTYDDYDRGKYCPDVVYIQELDFEASVKLKDCEETIYETVSDGQKVKRTVTCHPFPCMSTCDYPKNFYMTSTFAVPAGKTCPPKGTTTISVRLVDGIRVLKATVLDDRLQETVSVYHDGELSWRTVDGSVVVSVPEEERSSTTRSARSTESALTVSSSSIWSSLQASSFKGPVRFGNKQ